VFELPALWQRIDALDGKAKGDAQIGLYQATRDLVNAQTLWFLRNGSAMSDLAGTIAARAPRWVALRPVCGGPPAADRLLERKARRLEGGIPADLGADIAASMSGPGAADHRDRGGTTAPCRMARLPRHRRASAHRRPPPRPRHCHARLLRPPGVARR
jgi:hypothetical protein